jgi:hypothetical protein
LAYLKSWKVGLVLALIIPVGLFTTFRLTGVLPEPTTVSESVVLNTVQWQSIRPDGDIHIDKNVTASFNGEINLSHTILIFAYYRLDEDYGSDSVYLSMNESAALEKGFVNNVNVTFQEDYGNSEIDLRDVPIWYGSSSGMQPLWDGNLTVSSYAHELGGSGTKAFLDLSGLGQPKSVSFGTFVHWVLGSPQNQTHLLNVTMETTYYNGTGFERIVQPFQLKIAPGESNSVQTATEIDAGTYADLYLGVNGTEWYKTYLNQGEIVKLWINGTSDPVPWFNIFVYDAYGRLLAQGSPSSSQAIELTANATGYLYIKLQSLGHYGFYSMTVQE